MLVSSLALNKGIPQRMRVLGVTWYLKEFWPSPLVVVSCVALGSGLSPGFNTRCVYNLTSSLRLATASLAPRAYRWLLVAAMEGEASRRSRRTSGCTPHDQAPHCRPDENPQVPRGRVQSNGAGQRSRRDDVVQQHLTGGAPEHARAPVQGEQHHRVPDMQAVRDEEVAPPQGRGHRRR